MNKIASVGSVGGDMLDIHSDNGNILMLETKWLLAQPDYAEIEKVVPDNEKGITGNDSFCGSRGHGGVFCGVCRSRADPRVDQLKIKQD